MFVDDQSSLDISQVVNLYMLARFQVSDSQVVLLHHKRVNVKQCHKILAIAQLIRMSSSNSVTIVLIHPEWVF